MNNCTGHVADLLQVLEISRTLALNQDLQTLLKQIEQAAVKVLNCERATVFVYEKNTDELYSLVSDRAEKLRLSSDLGIVGACFKSGKLINVPDAYKDPRFNKSIDKKTGFKTRNILASPLLSGDQNIVGVLEVLNKSDGSFDEWDELLQETFSAQCGVAIHRHALMEEFATRKRLQQELAIARRIQRSLLPQSAPIIEGFDIAGWSQSAEETGGDFFDFHLLDDRKLILLIADVSGHGIGPALLAAECWALQRAIFSLASNYRASLSHINQLLCRHMLSDRFITAFTGCLNPNDNTLTFLSAGHGPVFMLRVAPRHIETLAVSDMPLGIMANNSYHQWKSIAFNTGDILIAFTDGFFEWEDALGNCFGTDRICNTVFCNAELPAAAIIEKVHSHLLSFTKGTQQQDDLTAIVIKKL
ncbi:Protein phosphatase 2C-like, stage II sporulation E [Candidatus Methylobacter favarea]|uniref:Protein phosphatase 2C-like, stage II sporulation E n=1 Tax=Candidatus Methylobacter favarea TaxID=2707345 RepID=A0A8S0Y8Q9_9GAMM|nr:SpoIIE family protein phosphatase [Candidatus Methylobacter favarea]CAA9889129.1 Protein phosphatase 2C-like, stage II sporulation E [Candidatus Methylobacter favarea]